MTVLSWLMALAAAAAPEPAAEPAPEPVAEPVPPPAPAAILPAPAPAAPGSTRLTLEEALRLAMEASETVVIAESDVTKAEGDRWISRSGLLPSVEASLTYQRTFASEFDDLDFGVPTGIPTGPTTGTPTTVPTTPTSTDDEESESVLPFGRPDNWRAGITVSEGIYGGGRTGALMKMSAAGTRSAAVSLESARASVALDTAQAYYDAALSDRLLEIAIGSLSQTEATLQQTELGQNVGRQPEFDVLRARVAVENQQVSVINARRQSELARQRLAQLLDLPATTPIDLASPLEESGVAEVAVEVSGAAPAGAVRAPVRQVTENAAIADANVTLARASALPTLGASLSVGWLSYDPFPLGADAEPWVPSSSASVALTVPLFNGGRVWGEVMKARADAVSAQARLDQTNELADLDARQAQAGLDAAAAQWDATDGAVEQAQRAYEIADLRFGEGVSTQIELSDARLQLERALVNRAQAARDLAVAKTRIALLASLPLQAATASSF